MLDPARHSRTVLASLTTDDRSTRLAELEAAVNALLGGSGTLAEFQTRLYTVIDDELVGRLGYWLGRWDYDTEVEHWGGQSYMDPTIPDELLLRSEFPHGVRLNWGVFEFKPWT